MENKSPDAMDTSQSVGSIDSDSFVDVDETDCLQKLVPSLVCNVTPRHDIIGLSSGICTTQICATIKAREIPDDETARTPVDIIVALDISSSMAGKKLELCKRTLQLLLRELRPSDSFGLITFSDDAKIEIPIRKLTERNSFLALVKISGLATDYGTNISAGIGMVAQEITSIEIPNEVRTIFLLTDGFPTCGITDAAGIVELTKGCLTHQANEYNKAPITIHTFGYGSYHDASLLRDISQSTPGGMYYFVESDSNVSAAFGDALGGILSVVAQSTTLTIQVPQVAAALDVKIANVYYDNKTKQDDGSFKVCVGDFYAEESRDVLVEVTLALDSIPAGEKKCGIPHCSFHLTYLDTVGKQLVKDEAITTEITRPSGAEISPPNLHVAVQWLRIRATQAMADSEVRARSGDLHGAKKVIQDCLEEIKNDSSTIEGAQSDPLVVQLLQDLNFVLAGLETQQSYQTFGSQTAATMRQTHTTQRGSFGSNRVHDSTNVYQLYHKCLMAHKLHFSSNRNVHQTKRTGTL